MGFAILVLGPGPSLRLSPPLGRDTRAAHASSFSRSISPPSFAGFSLAQDKGAERRQALGCLRGTLGSGPHDGGPQTPRNEAPLRPRADSSRRPRSRGTLASRRSTRRFFGSEPALAKRSGVAHERCPWFRIGAFARPARSSGRAVLPDASRGLACKATRRTPVPACSCNASREHP